MLIILTHPGLHIFLKHFLFRSRVSFFIGLLYYCPCKLKCVTQVPLYKFYTFVKMVTISLIVSGVLSIWNYNGNMIWGCFCRCFVLVVCGVSVAGCGAITILVIACSLEIVISFLFIGCFSEIS